MNILLFEPSDYQQGFFWEERSLGDSLLPFLESPILSSGRVIVKNELFNIFVNECKVKSGDVLHVGEINGCLGKGTVISVCPNELRLNVWLTDFSSPLKQIDVILAVPRPQMLKRALETAASLGVRRVVLIGSMRGEKSYLSSKALSPKIIRTHLLRGLGQSGATLLPEVYIQSKFFNFVKEDLPRYEGEEFCAMIADPRSDELICEVMLGEPSIYCREAVLAIGPEAGWDEKELELFQKANFRRVSLGERIMRVEVALPYMLGQINCTQSIRVRAGAERSCQGSLINEA